MQARRNIVSILIDVAAFIILEAAALSMLAHNGTLQNLWITRGLHAINASVWGRGESVTRYFSLRKENEALAQENAELREKLLQYEKVIREEEVGKGSIVGNYKYTPATIVKHSTNKQHNYIIMDKGTDDGVTVGSGVITRQGVIGIVDAASRHYCYVRSFNNKDMVISARIGRSGNIGALTWDGISTRKAILSEVPHHSVIDRGDTIYTSGFSSIFPPDVPLGLAGSSKIVGGSSYEIKVWMFEDFSRVRYATVVENIEKPEIAELEEEQK